MVYRGSTTRPSERRRNSRRSSRYPSPLRRASLAAAEEPPARSRASSPSTTQMVGGTRSTVAPDSRPAVPAAVAQLVGQQALDDAIDRLAEVRPVRERQPVDARLGLALEVARGRSPPSAARSRTSATASRTPASDGPAPGSRRRCEREVGRGPGVEERSVLVDPARAGRCRCPIGHQGPGARAAPLPTHRPRRGPARGHPRTRTPRRGPGAPASGWPDRRRAATRRHPWSEGTPGRERARRPAGHPGATHGASRGDGYSRSSDGPEQPDRAPRAAHRPPARPAPGAGNIVLDGAMGTMIQAHRARSRPRSGASASATTRSTSGARTTCWCSTQPDIIRGIHVAYLDAGADMRQHQHLQRQRACRWPTTGSSHGRRDERGGGAIARAAADAAEAADPSRPRFVAGSLGPTTRTASHLAGRQRPGCAQRHLGAARRRLHDAARGLVAGGADILLIETIFDTLNGKAAIFAVGALFEELGTGCP